MNNDIPQGQSKEEKRSRHIPREVKKEMDVRDSFECSWCGVKITERHHITEFHSGGENTVDNLILLCPTCHTEVHAKNGNIKKDELKLRKSNHTKGDRIAGNLPFTPETNRVRVGDLNIINHNPLLAFSEEPVFSLVKHGNAFVISCRFYDINGNLIFWMSENRYWATSFFEVSVAKNSLTISNPNDQNNFSRIEQIDDYFKVHFKSFYRGHQIEFNDQGVSISGKFFQQIGGEGTFDAKGKGFINL